MADEEKVIICSGKSASLSVESAIIAASTLDLPDSIVLELERAKGHIDRVVERMEKRTS